jgi:REP element-mobilizing transposase RayT
METTTLMQLRSAGEEKRPRFDYRGMHRYYITLVTHRQAPVFTNEDPVRQVLDVLRDQSIAASFEIVAYCFLPDRLIMIARGENATSDMKAFLSSFRGASSAALQGVLGGPLWKRSYMERVLRKTEETRVMAREVLSTPVARGLCRTPLEFPFLGSFVASPAVFLKDPRTPTPASVPGKPSRRAQGTLLSGKRNPRSRG